MSNPNPGKECQETNGWDGYNEKPNQYDGTHYTVYNEVARESWDTDQDGNYVKQDDQGRPTHHQTEVKK